MDRTFILYSLLTGIRQCTIISDRIFVIELLGKLAERRGRKAVGLRTSVYDCQVAIDEPMSEPGVSLAIFNLECGFMIKNVLVVDDVAFMRMRLRNIVEEFGTMVIGEATNGNEAIQKFQELKPGLVFLDITMPEMDGISALKAIREIDSSARVVMISAIGQKDVITDALKAGAKDYIIKPFNLDQVKTAIEKYLY